MLIGVASYIKRHHVALFALFLPLGETLVPITPCDRRAGASILGTASSTSSIQSSSAQRFLRLTAKGLPLIVSLVRQCTPRRIYG
jgi:hypothetical protein